MSTFTRDTFAYGLAVLVDRLAGLVQLPLLTYGLGKRDFGAWSQISATYGFFSTALLLGFFHTISDLAARRPPGEGVRVYAGVLGLVAVSTGIFTVFCLLLPNAISIVLFANVAYSRIIPAMSWFVSTECFYELVVLAMLRAQGKIALCSVFHGAKSVIRLLVIWIGLRAEEPLVAILVLLGLINALFFLYVLWRHVFPRGIASPLALGRRFWSSAIAGATATATAVLLAWGNMTLNRFILVHFEGLDELAVYSVNYSILSIVTLVPMILTFTLLHHLSVKLAAGAMEEASEIIIRSVTYYLYTTLPLLVLTGLFYQHLLELLAPGGYGAGIMLPLTLGAYFLVFGLEQILVFSTFPRGGVKALQARLAALVISLILAPLVISAFGLAFAALPLLAASLMIVIVCSFALRNLLGRRIPWSVSLTSGLAALVTAAVGWIMVSIWKPSGWWEIGSAALLVGGVYLIFESLSAASITRKLVMAAGHTLFFNNRRQKDAR